MSTNLKNTDIDVSNNIAVVYLSKSRKKPSEDSKSLIGFELTDQQLVWQGLADEDSAKKLDGFNLTLGQSIPFIHMGYFPAVERWASECMMHAPDGINSAFKDYLAVLKRINRQASWRNVMTLDQYALGLKEEDQKDMYAFMVEANKSLVDFAAIKLHDELKRIFDVSELVACDPYREITPLTLKNWLSKRPNVQRKWRDIACYTTDESKPKKVLLLAVECAYLSQLNEEGKVSGGDGNRVPYGNIRKILTEKDGLYKLIKAIESMLAKS